MSSQLNRKVFLIPQNEVDRNYSVLCLQHPKTSRKILCALDTSNKLYEIVHYVEEFASWFVGDAVVPDGRLFILTVVDPLFFILPYVSKEKKFCPLEDILVDVNFPNVCNLIKCCNSTELSNIFDFKESAGYKVYCYNKTKALHWLQRKVDYLTSALKTEEISINDGSKAASLQSNDKENPELRKSYACHLIADYLSEDLSMELFKTLGIPLKQEKPKLKESEAQAKKPNTQVSPTEDYSKNYSHTNTQEKQKSKLTSAQKQLMKVDKKGMKSISSFFTKK